MVTAQHEHHTTGNENEHEHPPHLQHHFDTPKQQFESGKLGMWVFLATEILFFGGLFVAYSVYRSNHPEIFVYAHQYLDKVLGGINTVVLICSSLTMAWAVRCAQLSQRKGLILCLLLTFFCACGFLGIKFVEYEHKWKHGLLWGTRYDSALHAQHGKQVNQQEISHQEKIENSPINEEASSEEATQADEPAINTEEQSAIAPAALGPSGIAEGEGETDAHFIHEPKNVHIFFGIYFVMTGLHGIHVLAGMMVIAWLIVGAYKGKYNADYFTPVDFVGLYWHLVDLIWIYLFPLLYLIV